MSSVSQPTAAPPPKGKKKLIGGILIGCGCLSFILAIILLGVYFMATRAGSALDKYKVSEGTSTESGAGESSPSEDVKTFVNSPEGRTGNLAESYADFHFDYPSSWTTSPQNADSSNFVTMARPEVDGSTTENLSIGYLQGSGSHDGDEKLFPQLMTQLYSQFSQQFQGLEKVSEGTSHIGEYNAYHGLFHSKVEKTGKTVDIFLRIALVPNPREGERNGVSMLMFATSAAAGISDPEDVGVKGELPVLLNSFRFGK
jgi:hypothetical protein